MRHYGKARQAALRIIYWSMFAILMVLLSGFLAAAFGWLISIFAGALILVWMIFGLFVMYFFRDPHPKVPGALELIVAPGHGKVDAIDEVNEPEFIGGQCRRVSTFLSVFDVHVQNAPVAGRIAFIKHKAGHFVNAMRADSADFNENILLGIESSERPGEKVALRLIAGLIARRIVPWVAPGDLIQRGERVSLIQFGSRVDLLLPLDTEVTVKVGDRVKGGETVIARRRSS